MAEPHILSETAQAPLSDTGHDARRSESLVGICAAIGGDFGFNPDILRVALAVSLLFAPMAVFAAYFGMGAFVLASRLLFPPVRRAVPASAATVVPLVRHEPVAAEPLLEAA